jgi:hypothetical protein
MSKVTGIQGLKGLNAGQASQMGTNSTQNAFTIEELLRRIHRLERLTDRMSKGVFEHPNGAQRKKAAENAIGNIKQGYVSQFLNDTTSIMTRKI